MITAKPYTPKRRGAGAKSRCRSIVHVGNRRVFATVAAGDVDQVVEDDDEIECQVRAPAVGIHQWADAVITRSAVVVEIAGGVRAIGPNGPTFHPGETLATYKPSSTPGADASPEDPPDASPEVLPDASPAGHTDETPTPAVLWQDGAWRVRLHPGPPRRFVEIQVFGADGWGAVPDDGADDAARILLLALAELTAESGDSDGGGPRRDASGHFLPKDA